MVRQDLAVKLPPRRLGVCVSAVSPGVSWQIASGLCFQKGRQALELV